MKSEKSIIYMLLMLAVVSAFTSASAASITIDNSADQSIIIDRGSITKNGFHVDATIKINNKKRRLNNHSLANLAMIDVEVDCVSKEWIIEMTALYEDGNTPVSLNNASGDAKDTYQQILNDQKVKAKIIRNLCRELY